MTHDKSVTARPKQIFRLAVRFGLVGLTSVGIYFVFFAILQQTITQTVIVTAVTYVLSAVFNYMAQSLFTFQTRSADTDTIMRYIAMHGLCMFLNSSLMYALVDMAVVNVWLSQIMVTGVVAATSFLLSYLWVYSRAEQHQRP